MLQNSLAVLTSAVLLVVETVFAEELVAALLKSAFAPVLCPKERTWHGLLRGEASFCDLVESLPSRGCKCCRKDAKSKFLRLFCSLQKSYAKTFEAPPAAFWLSLKARNSLAPCFVVVVAVYPLDVQRLCVAFALVLARLILLAWEYVRIIIEYCGLKSVCEHPFYYCRTAWCAAGMEQ